ncbi:MAG: zf-HC2 domain-containing protein [Gemmatimonadota bacterium]|nr:zf-HC2 domain-containing protein [Gemmatimonadota bacterium]
MQHPDEGTIHSWLDGALSADEAARVEAHVKECPQCAAAVAEARGFIAASSRILTALDNAPRGVIPAAAPRKRVDPLVWRVAATVLVVAAGTLVVVRNGERTARMESATLQSAPTELSAVAPQTSNRVGGPGTTSEALPPVSAKAQLGRSTAIRSQPNAAAIEKRGVIADGVTARGVISGGVAPSEKVATKESAPVAAPTAQTFAQSAAIGAAAMDAARELPPLKIVGTPRTLGARVTLYEVAPGDTVTLTEPMTLQLQSVVTTGIATQSPPRQSAGKSPAAAPTRRADAAVVSAPDSEQAAGVGGAPARALSTRVAAAQVEIVNGVTTISWADPTTGNVVRLSGRLPAAQLQQVRLRIERDRAAAAAAKKNP